MAIHRGREYAGRISELEKGSCMTDAAVSARVERGGEIQAVGLVSTAHFVSHFPSRVTGDTAPYLARRLFRRGPAGLA